MRHMAAFLIVAALFPAAAAHAQVPHGEIGVALTLNTPKDDYWRPGCEREGIQKTFGRTQR